MENNTENTRYHPKKQRPALSKAEAGWGLSGAAPRREEVVQGMSCELEKDASDPHAV